jgi:DNA-binding XRE family transcriptional regulator
MKQAKSLSDKMIDYRAKHGLSLGKFAELCGLSAQTVCNVENGIQKPSKITERKILNIVDEV